MQKSVTFDNLQPTACSEKDYFNWQQEDGNGPSPHLPRPIETNNEVEQLGKSDNGEETFDNARIRLRKAKEITSKYYPTHGVIGSKPPAWFDLGTLHRNPVSQHPLSNPRDCRRRKLDLEGALGSCNSFLCPHKDDDHHPTELPVNENKDWNEGKRTSEVYSTVDPNLPDRFDNPSWFVGYGKEKQSHPFYATTSSQYGFHPPNIHTMPLKYCPMKKFLSENLTNTGMSRNRSLNIK